MSERVFTQVSFFQFHDKPEAVFFPQSWKNIIEFLLAHNLNAFIWKFK